MPLPDVIPVVPSPPFPSPPPPHIEPRECALGITHATRRGCPVDVLRAEHERHKSIQTEPSRARMGELPGEYPAWKAGRGAEDAVEL